MSYKIVIINGIARSGKDTFCDFVEKHYGGVVLNYSSVELVKKLLFECTGNKKTGKERTLWATVKDALITYDDVPFKDIIEYIKYSNGLLEKTFRKGISDTLYFIHCREPEEIQKLKDYYGDKATTLVIKRNVRIPGNSGDSLVGSGKYDMQIDNIGTIDELEAMAKHFAETI